ncbi:1-aminocyclopropane-1-carboxylate synthase-like protein 1 [Ptychodera flava]|uniref:1-aminocyclopropane-1-carboxylate synthase-like protein 1 n=1 Tax=Ptychodera flava TaxID=63121 RepID=UPI00396A4D96
MDISNSVGKSNVLSKRGLRIMNDSSILEIGMLKCQTNGYSDANPSGVINAGTAENTISNDIIAEKLSQVESPYLDDPDILKYKTSRE